MAIPPGSEDPFTRLFPPAALLPAVGPPAGPGPDPLLGRSLFEEPPPHDDDPGPVWPEAGPSLIPRPRRAERETAARAGLRERVPQVWREARWRVTSPAAVVVFVLALLVLAAAGGRLWWNASSGAGEVQTVPDAAPGLAVGTLAPSASGAAPAAPVTAGPTVAGGTTAAAGTLVVDVVGQVRRPGVVTLPTGSRVTDAVGAAGGALPGAGLAGVNLARLLVDGEQIVVPRPGETPPPAAVGGAGQTGAPAAGAAPGAPIDLNAATEGELDALPGIGPVLAGRIVAHRTENGRFVSVDELGDVDGIGEKVLSRLRPLVRV